jgi:hypothetical protein
MTDEKKTESKLSKLFGETLTKEIGGVEFIFKPLTIEHMDVFMDLENEKTRGPAMKRIVMTTIQACFPDASVEEINKIGVKHFTDIVSGILEVNGLSGAANTKLEVEKALTA